MDLDGAADNGDSILRLEEKVEDKVAMASTKYYCRRDVYSSIRFKSMELYEQE